MSREPSYSDDEVRRAVAASRSWREVLRRLGLHATSGSQIRSVRGHADRIGVDTEHLSRCSPVDVRPASDGHHGSDAQLLKPEPKMENLSRAGVLIAAAWYTMCGSEVSWPLEPCRYDLLEEREGRIRRVQVKTTTVQVGRSWKVYLSTTSGGRRVYGRAEIEEFFVITGDLALYVVPIGAVCGRQALHLGKYEEFRVGSWSGLLH
ncbi:hypothetical protein HUN08_08190 [Gordonia sp. X0973]|uniref:group I intron-associated PD-(D/E)XK endonuclease n=1 Tax=Gordonia sp. X0973 TaxID=2742602 RepID=UPI000F5281F6|nr:group I intron-associated PD-(D/E)XK endonuclease [Gordonia sp. X0973]QKT07177.1 hypothetical protein HUN08_08190 [Gordonia sp. X0973]